jgi:hypothetical protein
MSDENDELTLKFIGELIQSPHRPSETQICPECHGTLHVLFEAYTRGKKKMLGVQVRCDHCGLHMFIDYGEPLPAWVS